MQEVLMVSFDINVSYCTCLSVTTDIRDIISLSQIILNAFRLQEMAKVNTVFDREEVDPGKVVNNEKIVTFVEVTSINTIYALCFIIPYASVWHEPLV